MIGEEQQDQGEDEHPEDLGRHADVVEDRQETDTERVDQRRQHQGHERHEGEHRGDPGRIRAVEEAGPVGHRAMDAIDDERDDDRHGGDRDDLRPEVEPASEPPEGSIAQAL